MHIVSGLVLMMPMPLSMIVCCTGEILMPVMVLMVVMAVTVCVMRFVVTMMMVMMIAGMMMVVSVIIMMRVRVRVPVPMIVMMVVMGMMVMPVPMFITMMVSMPVFMAVTVMMVMPMMVMVAASLREGIGLHQRVQIEAPARHLHVLHALVEHLEDFFLEAEIRRVCETDLRVLLGKTLHLAVDALDERAGEQVIGHDDDLHHAEFYLILHGLFQAWAGNAGKGQIDPGVLTDFMEPARHLCHIAVGQAITGAPAQQDDAGGFGIGHVQLKHCLAQQAPQDAQERIADTQIGRIEELHLGMAFLRCLDGKRNVHAYMAGRIQDERHDQHALTAPGGLGHALPQRGIAEFDEAGFDAPFGMAILPQARKTQDFLVARLFAGAVTYQQDGVFQDASPVC